MRKIQLEVEGKKERLDRYLADRLADLSRSRIQQLIAENCVRLNDSPCTAKREMVRAGDRVTLTIPDPEPVDLIPDPDIPLSILYEDAELLVIDKQADLVVHPAAGHANDTLVNALLAYCPDLQGIGGERRPGIVHRLDKDTTGAIAIAKTERALAHLQRQIKAKTARREYLGIVYGAPKTEGGTVDAPLGRHPGDRKKMAVVPVEKGGRRAVTHWQVRERLGNYTLIYFQLETGRTHQIRVHCAHLGHPIVGDPIYSKGRSPGVKLTGQALHAWRLTLEHPVTGETIAAIAPLPEIFQTLLDVLRRRSGRLSVGDESRASLTGDRR